MRCRFQFRTENYYDERNLKAGEEIHWDDDYLNESSLSNDWYTEHALDKFGWIPARDMHTAAYMAEATRSSGGFFGGGTSGGANFGLIDALGNPKLPRPRSTRDGPPSGGPFHWFAAR